MAPEELGPQRTAEALQGAALVYFDGRLTEAAVLLARAARERGIPVGGRGRAREGRWGLALMCRVCWAQLILAAG